MRSSADRSYRGLATLGTWRRAAWAGVLGLGVVNMLVVAVLVSGYRDGPQAVYRVTQRGRAFHPDRMTILRGDTLRIVNDDGDLRHHAYVDSNTFRFDSGDQEPGTSSDITFTARGVFNVLCGIHPMMRLIVTVK